MSSALSFFVCHTHELFFMLFFGDVSYSNPVEDFDVKSEKLNRDMR